MMHLTIFSPKCSGYYYGHLQGDVFTRRIPTWLTVALSIQTN